MSACAPCAPSRRCSARSPTAPRAPSRRAQTPGTTRFLDLVIEGDENSFVERTMRIRQVPADEAEPIKAALIAAIPEKRGRVT